MERSKVEPFERRVEHPLVAISTGTERSSVDITSSPLSMAIEKRA
jgi:hypothetical protein